MNSKDAAADARRRNRGRASRGTQAVRLVNPAALLTLLCAAAAFGELRVGEKPPPLVLHGKNGGRVDREPFCSSEIQGKLFLLFYVDPDEKDRNKLFERKLEAENFPGDRVGTIAVINMSATRIWNRLIAFMLARTQRQYPDTIYVKDYTKQLVRVWGLKDHSYDVVLFDWSGTVLFKKSGTLSEEEAAQVILLIRERIADPAPEEAAPQR